MCPSGNFTALVQGTFAASSNEGSSRYRKVVSLSLITTLTIISLAPGNCPVIR